MAVPVTTPADRAARAADVAALSASYLSMINLCNQSYNAAYSELVLLRRSLWEREYHGHRMVLVKRIRQLRHYMEVDAAVIRADEWAMKTLLLQELEVREAEEREERALQGS